MKLHKRDSIQIYDYEGEGQTLLLVHAFPMDNTMWHNQVKFFSNKMRVITFDIRGFGNSIDDFEYIYTMENFANDVLGIIEHLKLENVNICGLSMGGYIVQRAVIKNPDYFSTMILADSRAEREDSKGTLSRAKFIKRLQNEGLGNFPDEFMKRLMYIENYNNKGLYDFVHKKISEQNVKGLIGASIAMSIRTNTIDYFDSIKIPVLIMVGEQDTFTPFRYSEAMHKVLEKSELKTIPLSGHLSPIENPEIFNNYLFDFLKKHNCIL